MSASQQNSNQKIYKFMFQAHVKTVSLALKFPCVVSVIWKRGQKAQQVKQRKPIEKGIINFNQSLQIQCNMTFDVQKKLFQQKKTKFTILIFSQKGNKQAGQVYLDVAQLLNSKSKSLQLQKTLQKCPDKNAKLKVSLTGYMKEEITPDMVSHKSQKTYDIQANLNSNAPAIQPDFKKKKNETLVDDRSKQQKILSPATGNKTIVSSSNQKNQKSQKVIHSLSKQNVSKLKLQEQNKKLKQQLKQLRDLQIQNQNLKRKYQQADKKAQSYYKKKYQQMKDEYNELKQKNQQIIGLTKKKQELQNVYCQSKQTLGKIFNYAIMNQNIKLMEIMEQFQ